MSGCKEAREEASDVAALEPQYGDEKVTGSCGRCGGELVAEFTYQNVYHNETEDVWRQKYHDCVVELTERIQELVDVVEQLMKGRRF